MDFGIKRFLASRVPMMEPDIWMHTFTDNAFHPAVVGDGFEEAVQEPIPYVFMFPVFSEAYCDWLIAFAESRNKWRFNDYDPYTAWETDLKRLSRWTWAAHKRQVFPNVLSAMTEGMFGYQLTELVNSFLIKYEPTHCDSMGMHYDEDSLFSVSINLNDGFDGGHMTFLRYQNYRICPPKGWGVLFAGTPMMMHEAHPVRTGTRYVMVYWVS